MTNDDVDEEQAEQATDQDVDQSVEQADDEKPEMDQEEMADLDGLAEEIEQDTKPDTTGEAAESGADDPEPTGEDPEESVGTSEDHSWGDMYVGTLTTVSNAVIDEHGLDDADQIEEQLARDLHLDEYFDEWMEKRGKADMPPEQGVLIGSTMFLVAVIGTKTDIPSKVLNEADF